MKRLPLLLAVLALVLWVYFNNRQDEMYNPDLDKLLNYITRDDFDPDTFKKKLSEMTNDKQTILIAHTLAKQGKYDELFYFVEDVFGAPKI
jgi:hypothetical protein